jgi:hypothetical protein
LATGVAAFAALAATQLSACSTSQPRDINDGTDVGLFYVPPGADDAPSADAAVMDSATGDSADSAVVDGGATADAAPESAT